MSIAAERATLWRPLRVPLFRQVFIADLVSDIGTFMQSVGAAWLMVSLGGDTTMVALTQTASSLPFFLFALPAGAIGDIVDRRRLILYCEYLDGWRRDRARSRHHRRRHLSMAAAGADIRPRRRRCYRDTDLASRIAGTGRQGRPAGRFGSQRHRVQFRASGRPGAGRRAHRRRWSRSRVRRERDLIRRRARGHRAVATADAQTPDRRWRPSPAPPLPLFATSAIPRRFASSCCVPP